MTTTTKLAAYHGDPDLKEKILAQIAMHRAADEIAKGIYYESNGEVRVCAVGCVLHDPDGGHARYETEFGIPAQLAHLEDGLFESMPLDQAKEWPHRFMSSIAIGADLATVWPRFAVWLMTDEKWGLVNVTEAEDVKAVCLRVADAYSRIADGVEISDEEAAAITKAARDARDARDAWDAWAAWAAWDAWAAWAARAARDARDAFVAASADKLIELLEAAPVPNEVAA